MKKKYLWMAVIVVILAIGIYTIDRKDQSNSPSVSASPSSSANSAATSKKAVARSTPGATARTYSDLVKEYQDRRIQFDQNCQMIPGSPTYKSGTKIMLDNRSAEPKKVTIGGVSYSLIAYGYQLVTLSSKNLPQELWLNCGSAVNVGKILLQALILP